MFQNLQTWHIIAIVLSILAVVAIAVYMMSGEKEEKNVEKKEEFNELKKIIVASSGQSLMASTSDSTNDLSIAAESLYKSIGMELCNKPIEYANLKQLQQNISNKISGNPAETLIFYIYLSDKLSLFKKKDFIGALFLENQERTRQANPGSLPTAKLIEGGKVECKNALMFCQDKNIFTVEEFANELFELATTVFNVDKMKNIYYNMLKKQKPEASESDIQVILKPELDKHIQKMTKLRNEIEAAPLCTLY